MVLNKIQGGERRATSAQVEKLGAIFLETSQMPWPSDGHRQSAEQKIYVAFCLTVHGHQNISGLFMSQEPAVAVLFFGTMPID
jgi:hypothetical protein